MSKDKQLLFWRGLIGNCNDINTYQSTFDKLKNGEFKAVNLKKMRGHNIYSVRINDSDRLLFTTVSINDQPYLLLLEVVLNHDYQKSRFLKPNVLKQFIEHQKASLTNLDAVIHFEDVQQDQRLLDSLPETYQHYTPASFFNEQFIILNDAQNEALQGTFPFVLSGEPGSGKSCVAMAILEQQSANPLANNQRILYVTKSSNLAEKMANMWKKRPEAENQATVNFMTYLQLIRTLNPDLDEDFDNIANFDTFSDWYTGFIRQAYNKQNAPGLLKNDSDKLLRNLYQEFRIISGYNNCQDYQKLGKRQSLFYEEEKDLLIKLRAFIFDAYGHYQAYLNEASMFDPSLYHHPDEHLEHWDCIVVDEAQDLSHRQLITLYKMAINQKVCFCLDTHQSLFDTLSKRAFLLNIDNMSHLELGHSYRCPPNVQRLADEVLSLKLNLTGGTVDKNENTQMSAFFPLQENDSNGYVDWVDESDEQQLNLLSAKGTSVNFAVVTPEVYLEEARGLFKTELVFTPEQIKGLEYPEILLYKPLEPKTLFQQVNTLIGASKNSAAKPKNRPKNGQANFEYGPIFNQLFTAITRASSAVYIFQKKAHDNTHIVKRLKTAISAQPFNDSIQTETNTDKPSQTEDWIDEMRKLHQYGNSEQARNIYKHKVRPHTSISYEQLNNITDEPALKKINHSTGNDKGKESIPDSKNNEDKALKKQPAPTKRQKRKNKKYQKAARTHKKKVKKATSVNNGEYTENKKEKFLTTFFEGLDELKLEALFKNNDRVLYLFDVPFRYKSELETLYGHCSKNKDKGKIFKNLIVNKPSLLNLFSESDLRCMVENDLGIMFSIVYNKIDGLNLFEQFLRHCQAAKQVLTIQNLCKNYVDGNARIPRIIVTHLNYNFTLFNMLISMENYEALKLLIVDSKELDQNELMTISLALHNKMCSYKDKIITVLSYASSCEQSLSFLHGLFSKNPSLTKFFEINDFFSIFSMADRTVIPFFELCQSNSGTLFLNTLQKNNSGFLNETGLIKICYFITNYEEIYSSFLELVNYESGREFLGEFINRISRISGNSSRGPAMERLLNILKNSNGEGSDSMPSALGLFSERNNSAEQSTQQRQLNRLSESDAQIEQTPDSDNLIH